MCSAYNLCAELWGLIQPPGGLLGIPEREAVSEHRQNSLIKPTRFYISECFYLLNEIENEKM